MLGGINSHLGARLSITLVIDLDKRNADSNFRRGVVCAFRGETRVLDTVKLGVLDHQRSQLCRQLQHKRHSRHHRSHAIGPCWWMDHGSNVRKVASAGCLSTLRSMPSIWTKVHPPKPGPRPPYCHQNQIT